jgi:hypothetical protein
VNQLAAKEHADSLPDALLWVKDAPLFIDDANLARLLLLGRPSRRTCLSR